MWKYNSALHLQQQLFHAIKTRHLRLAAQIPNVRSNNFKGNSWIF